MKAIAFLLCTCLLFVGKVAAQNSTLQRPYDPVILTGNNLPAFMGNLPAGIVGFSYGTAGWKQIPVQVDERVLLDLVRPYGLQGLGQSYPTAATNPAILFYADSKTKTGPDTNALFDADDELVFMAADAGGQAPANAAQPAGTLTGSLREVSITDPLGGSGFVYLARTDGSLLPAAGKAYVTVTTNLPGTSGFPVNTKTINPENTYVQTPRYRWHQSAEWITDELHLPLGNDSDILDRHKNFFVDGFCGRSEDSFSYAENAFETVILGPVRAIRGIMGANSGVTTERRHFFYAGRIDVVTFLRVHTIPGVCDVFDYSPAANGMTYRNNLNTAGVTIDGQPDNVVKGDIDWEQVSGTQGTLSIVLRRNTNIASAEGTFTSYYDESLTAPASNCTGDGQAWGTSGMQVFFTANPNICTDPVKNCAPASLRNLTLQRTLYFAPPNAPANTASKHSAQYDAPLQLGGTALSIEKPAPALLAFTVYPNPTIFGEITVQLPQSAILRVFNSLGQLLLSQSLPAGENKVSLPGRGLLLLEVSAGGARTTQTVVVP